MHRKEKKTRSAELGAATMTTLSVIGLKRLQTINYSIFVALMSSHNLC